MFRVKNIARNQIAWTLKLTKTQRIVNYQKRKEAKLGAKIKIATLIDYKIEKPYNRVID